MKTLAITLMFGGFLFMSPSPAMAQNDCLINSLQASPSQVSSGNSSTLVWNTSGCTSLRLSGGSFSNTPIYQQNGSISTGALTSPTTFTLYASNSGRSTNRSVAVSVIGNNNGTGQYVCSDGYDNDGDGYVDYPADQGCYSEFDTSEDGSTATIQSVTTSATNVGASTARLNGLIVNANQPVTAYFEYGTTQSLGQTTPAQYVSARVLLKHSVRATIQTNPSTTYYYRMVVQTNGTTLRGGTASFTTRATDDRTYIIDDVQTGDTNSSQASGGTTGTTGSNSTSIGSSSTGGTGLFGNKTPAELLLTIENEDEKIYVGGKVNYEVKYENATNSTLSDAKLTVVFPQGIIPRQASQGRLISQNDLLVELETLVPGSKGSIYIEADVDQSVARNESLVTTATLEYQYPSGTRDTVVSYVINTAIASSTLGGIALGSGFFPNTIFGWFITILIILALVLISRRLTRGKRLA